MGGGGKGGGGGQAPQFVREGTQRLAQRSQQLFDISRPMLEQGTSQIASLIRTGGPGANVPILNNAIAAQQSANRQVQSDISGDLQRAGLERPVGVPGGVRPVPGRPPATTGPVRPGNFQQINPFGQRIRSQLGREGEIAAARIPIRAATPLQTAAISGALSGGQLAGAGFRGGLGALAQGARVGEQARIAAQASRRETGIQFGRNLLKLTQAGGFDFAKGLFGQGGPSGVGADSPAFSGFTPRPIQGGLPF